MDLLVLITRISETRANVFKDFHHLLMCVGDDWKHIA
jgi:hypothetical protein